MLAASAILAFALVISLSLTPRVRALAQRAGVIDHALSERKVHGRPIPRMGGLAIAIAFAASLSGAALAWEPVRTAILGDGWRALAIGLGGLAVVLLGIYDDLRGAGARLKFTVQFAVAGALYWAGVRIEQVDNPFGGAIALGWLSLPVTALWIAGVANAMNLIDGLDGLAGGLALAAAATAFAIAVHAGDPIGMSVAAALAGAVAGFLVFNFNPASIFMGDTGSLFLGYVLAVAAVRPHERGAHDAALIASIFALAVPIADTFLAMSRRAARGAPLFRADREHLHHLLLDRGLSHRAVVLVMWGAAAIFATAGVVLANRARGRGPIFVALVMLATIALYAVGSLGRTSLGALLERRRANQRRLRAVDEAGRRLRQAAELGEIEAALSDVAPALEARRIALHLGEPTLALANTVRFGLDGERPGLGALAVAWSDARPRQRDREMAVELLCRHVAAAVGRLELVAPTPQPHWLAAIVGAATDKRQSGRRVA